MGINLSPREEGWVIVKLLCAVYLQVRGKKAFPDSHGGTDVWKKDKTQCE